MDEPLKKVISLLILGLWLVAGAGPALAQENVLPMQQLQVSVWPEYDQPQVLVIYNGVLVNNTGEPFQGEIRYRLPQGAQVNMVCELEKGMVCQPYDTPKGENGVEVVWRPSRVLQPGETFPVMFEYYYQPVAGAGERDLEFTYQESFPVERLQISIQQPLRAEGFQVDPPADYLDQEDVNGQQFTNHNYQFNGVAPGQQFAFKITYSKPDAEPSVTPAAAATTPAQPEPSSPSPFSTTVIVILVAFVVVLAFFLLYPRRNAVPSPTSGRSRSGGKDNHRKGTTARARAAGPAGGAAVADSMQAEKKKIRKMLLDGKISEDTYRQLLAEIEKDSR